MDYDFLIVGGGIGGGTLANLLARQGRRVLVLEKESAPKTIIRPELLWPATLRTLGSVLTPEALDTAALPLRGITVSRGRRVLADVRFPDGPPAYRMSNRRPGGHPALGACSTNPNVTRALLLGTGAFELWRGATIVSLTRDARQRIIGARVRREDGSERDLTARWTVADDGPRSSVRAQCGIELTIHPLPLDLLCFAVEWPRELPEAVARIWLNERGPYTGLFAMGALPWPAGKGTGLVAARSRLVEDPVAAPDTWRRFLARSGPSAGLLLGARRFPEDFIRVRTGFGLAPRFGAEGVVLMGDAAHPVTPAGGQGANLSVADAVALADVAARAPDEELVAQYERRRRPAAERSIRFSRAVVALLGLPDAVAGYLFPVAFGLASAFPALGAPIGTRLTRAMSTAFR